jgi:hypothetical protein
VVNIIPDIRSSIMNGSGLKIALFGFVALMSVAPSLAHAACAVPAPLNAAQVQEFIANSGSLLTRHASGGTAMVAEVRNLVSSDANTLSPIMSLLKDATPSQQSAIGTGLGQASSMCLVREPATTQAIQRAVVAADSAGVSLAFQAVTGDTRTTAVGGGGDGGGGGLGGAGVGPGGAGVGAGGSGSGAAATSNSTTANATFAFGGGGGSSVNTGASSGLVTIVTGPASP